MRNCKAIIHLHNLQFNIEAIRSITGGKPRICLAVKADGYGHGAVRVAQAAAKSGVDCFGVATAGEALELRAAGIKNRIILLGLGLPGELTEVLKSDVSVVVGDRGLIDEYARGALAASVTGRVHLKIDTGMGRVGCTPEEAPALAARIVETPGLELEGICTHFPVADADDPEYTREQIRRFVTCIEGIKKSGLSPGVIHAANSAGFQRFPDSWFDMIRVGIAAYGYPGCPGTGLSASSRLSLKPVMEVRAPVVFLKEVPAGTPLSYGHTYTTTSDTIIGTVAAGYADGYSRALSNIGRVTIEGASFPVVGAVCMDQFLVDLGPKSRVKLYDEAVLFGPDDHSPDAAEIAGLLGTVPYEVTCGINARVPRIYGRS
jgi:alanine racemase